MCTNNVFGSLAYHLNGDMISVLTGVSCNISLLRFVFFFMIAAVSVQVAQAYRMMDVT